MRDYLRCHATDRQRYQDAKVLDIEMRFQDLYGFMQFALTGIPNITMKDYRLGKTKVMEEIAERARAWYREQTEKK
jgi:hypothetical protein